MNLSTLMAKLFPEGPKPLIGIHRCFVCHKEPAVLLLVEVTVSRVKKMCRMCPGCRKQWGEEDKP